MTALKPEALDSVESLSECDQAPDLPCGPDPSPELPPGSAARIGTQLRGDYAGLVREPVPDRLLQLLEQLQQKEGL